MEIWGILFIVTAHGIFWKVKDNSITLILLCNTFLTQWKSRARKECLNTRDTLTLSVCNGRNVFHVILDSCLLGNLS